MVTSFIIWYNFKFPHTNLTILLVKKHNKCLKLPYGLKLPISAVFSQSSDKLGTFGINLPWEPYLGNGRAGLIALWNRSIALRSWANLYFGAMALNKNKSDERNDKIQILSGSLMRDIRIKECRKNGWKTHKMKDLYIF